MPLGKYYCDYCDKEFQDSPVARKRHLQSTSHLRNKSLWYHSQQPSSSHPISSLPKGVCNRFFNTGFCPYGDSCKYSHSLAINSSNNNNASSIRGDVVRDIVGMSLGNLPPSLRPPPEGGYLVFPTTDWG